MAAVIYGAEAPDEDVHAVLRQLREDADALGLDMDRLGRFAASGNVTVGLSALMRDRHVRCAARWPRFPSNCSASESLKAICHIPSFRFVKGMTDDTRLM